MVTAPFDEKFILHAHRCSISMTPTVMLGCVSFRPLAARKLGLAMREVIMRLSTVSLRTHVRRLTRSLT